MRRLLINQTFVYATAVTLFTTLGALAQSDHDSLNQSSGGFGPSTRVWSHDFDVSRIDPAALDRAIRSIEGSTGGKVIEARMSAQTSDYDAVIIKNGKKEAVRMHADRVRPIAANAVPEWGRVYFEKKDIVRDVASANIDITTAIKKAADAEKDSVPVFAGFTESPSREVQAYNVAMVGKNGHADRIVIDAKTGSIIADPQALSGWP